MRGPVGRYLSARLHREVRILGDLNVKLFSWTPTAVVNDLVIDQPQWAAQEASAAAPAGMNDFANVQRLTISLDLKQLLGWHIVLPMVDVERPRLAFLRDEAGRANWNFDDETNPRPFRLPPIRHFVIQDGRLDLTDAKEEDGFRRRLLFGGNQRERQRPILQSLGQGPTQSRALLRRGQRRPAAQHRAQQALRVRSPCPRRSVRNRRQGYARQAVRSRRVQSEGQFRRTRFG